MNDLQVYPEPTTRLGIYIIPEACHPLYQIGSQILGWDIRSQHLIEPPACFAHLGDQYHEWIGPAHHYGIHATIGDALDYRTSDTPTIEWALESICRETSPFTLVNGRIHSTFRAFPRALAATFDNPDQALATLENRIVTTISPMREASPIFSAYIDRFHGLARDQFLEFGSPMVRSLFDLHVTLASGIPNSEVWRYLVDRISYDLKLFNTPSSRLVQVDRLHLVEMGPDERYKIRRSFDLDRKQTPTSLHHGSRAAIGH